MIRTVFQGFITLMFLNICLLAQSQYIAHVTSSTGGFETSFWLANTNSDATEFNMTGISPGGLTSIDAVRVLGAGETQFVSLTELFGVNEIAWIILGNGTGVEVTVVYQAKGTDKVSAHSHRTQTVANRWRIYAGDNRLVWDGVAVINPNEGSSSLIYEGFDAAGESLGSISPFAPLMPLGKDIHVLSDSFTGAAYYEVSSQLPVVVTSLRGDLGTSDRLWVNPAIALDGNNTE